MPLPTTPTTELEAVNAMLDTIGQKNITALPPAASNLDATFAYRTLGEAYRAILARGWWFNLEDYEFAPTPGANYSFQLPDLNALGVKVLEQAWNRDFVPISGRLYDRVSHTYENFPASELVKVQLTRIKTWVDLPESARRYIFIAAARVFQDRAVGSVVLHGYTENDELMARAQLEQTDAEVAQWSFAHSDLGRAIARR